ncbi:DNA-binding protein H-NS [Variovorax boronicumulans]|uniref:H-NS histone family protein n=1 Tax=Variovorax boronicumulans TaxID=436515 RepID=UPI00278A9328|nr:H-NS histone family protein [Variovorax boronicumulans]MDP9995170.1 DNA-binding protein H-NS [Variovorax boronicumulans]MDQ0006460.1 DNA-binding protein H-NS [Variovorax boronicumulans]
MAKTFLQVQKQIEELQKEAEQLRRKEADGVRSRIKEAIAVYGFTAAELGFGKTSDPAPKVKKGAAKKTNGTKKAAPAAAGAPKFKDEQGNVWSGRGPRPAWFKAALEAGKSAEELLAR